MTKHLRLAIISLHETNAPPSIRDSLTAYATASKFTVHNYNLAELLPHGSILMVPPEFSAHHYDAILLHNTLSYHPHNIASIVRSLRLSSCSNPPALFLFRQDENNSLGEFRNLLARIKFDHIFTCLRDSDIPTVYGVPISDSTTFSRVLTGYIHPRLQSLRHPSYDGRSIDIGYRGSIQDLTFGRLAYEKYSIGTSVADALTNSELTLDISSAWENRLGPDRWISFLLNCKATLGAESGASVFDLDGNLHKLIANSVKTSPYDHHSSDHAEHVLAAIEHLEYNVDYRQISPRHLEAACCKTLQILFPGEYSGILKPFEHYLPLERDLSNLPEVIQILKSPDAVSTIVETAYDSIALNSNYSLSRFCEIVDEAVERVLSDKERLGSLITLPGFPPSDSNPIHHGINLCAHKTSLDPRLRWISECSPPHLSISQIGIDRSIVSSQINPFNTGFVVDLALLSFDRSFLDELRLQFSTQPSSLASLLINQISTIYHSLSYESAEFCQHYGIPSLLGRESSLRWYLRYFLDNCRTLYTFVQAVSDVSFVIATDLDALLPALLLKAFHHIPVFYDAHKFWPENDPGNHISEVHFWIQLERLLITYSDYRHTVSAGLADYMSSLYGHKFESVPNEVPLSASLSTNPSFRKEISSSSPVRFIYQGNYAPHRGLDLLIHNWRSLPPDALLYLRGPLHGEYRQYLVDLARDNRTLNRTIFFLPPVSEDLLVESAANDGDIGIVPYTPFGTNYFYCCPNKLSQYMAAGIPVFSNEVSFIPDFVASHGIGWSADFSDCELFRATITSILNNRGRLADLGRKAFDVHQSCYNWQRVSSVLYDDISRSPLVMPSADTLTIYELPKPRQTVELVSAQLNSLLKRSIVKAQSALPAAARSVIKPVLLPVLRLVSRYL